MPRRLHLTTSDVCLRAGVTGSALRHYEDLALVRSRIGRGQRRWHPETLDRLALVRLGRRAGFSLREIANDLAEHLPFGAGPADEDWQLLLWHWRRRVVDRTQVLDEVADDLRRCLSCSCAASEQCPLPALYTPLPDWGQPLDAGRPGGGR